ncbi:Sulfate transport system permease protein CysT [Gammaproteobacteria bacterium]
MNGTSVAVEPGRGGLMIRGWVIAYVAMLIVIPLLALIVRGLTGGPSQLWAAITTPVALNALILTLWTAGAISIINAVMGTATAWVLVRYQFPGRTILSALVDLPFAIPTLVTGVMLVILFGPQSLMGKWLAGHGMKVAFASPSILLALMFISLPFVVRAVEPVLMEQDPAEEEAARTLGAGPLTTFVRVLLPPIVPAILSGTIQSFARALGEFGSIVVVSGNIPYRTLTSPVYLFGEIESGRSDIAAAVSILLLVIALGLNFAERGIRRLMGMNRA